MNTTLHTTETAPAGSRPLLEGVNQAYGFIPNLLASLAEAPAALEGYLALSKIYGNTSFSATEQQVVSITASIDNGCTYCVAAHTTISQGQQVDAAVLDALRNEEPLTDPKLEALRNFALAVVRDRGWVNEQDQSAFLAAGYSAAQALEVVLGVTLKTLTNYTNHLFETPVDAPFQANAWSAPQPA